ncbi:Winged helix DNA-binding protein [Venustampulla echinocandica]|uniref:Winged helix DNA-binding protein n=1 Tax=Venustampulla echinocandica TaxID=2656787 RepID=A0A370U2W0_9HELO|nr:Winged helix DNA-binding protein [Venustampulla echinocandica]RDL42109.1 Winged helix DNA-binding protein [Venustampulla echinocandica]
MSSTTSRSTGDLAANPPMFSYAQAAKGRAAATAPSSATSNQATSGVSTPARDPHSTVDTPLGGSERGDQSVNGGSDVPHRAEQSGNASTAGSRTAASTKSISRPASPSALTASTSTLPIEDKEEFTLVGGSTPDSTRDRNSHNGNSAEKGAETPEGRKSKKGKKQKNAEKEAADKEKDEVKQPEILVPAPLPTFNFWQLRKEEAAKSKPASAAAPTQATSGPQSSNDNSRSPHMKRRGKPTGIDENDKPVGVAQNGGVKDPASKQRKSSEGGKAKDDQSPKSRGPRGSRVGEKDEKSSAGQLPPPVEDAMSWPTPETALEEEKRKAQDKFEKEEKDDIASNKPRQKEKWVPVPYVPSVAFNTPLPPRGGRGRGGARGGRTEAGGRSTHAANAGSTGEKLASASTTLAPSPSESDKRMNRGDAPRAASLPPNSSKRQAADASGTRDQGKPSMAASAEKQKGGASKGELNDNGVGEEVNPDQYPRAEQGKSFKSDNVQGASQESHVQARAAADRRSDPNLRGFDQAKEGANFGKDPRERADGGRPERGRGGFRGRGNHNFQNSQQHPPHIFTNGHVSQPSNGYPVRQGSAPYSPPLQQPPFNNHYPIPSSRGGRGGSRSQSIPGGAVYGRYPHSAGPVAQHMPPLQTNAMYDYPHMQHSMSAVPYNPYVDQISVLGMVTMQLEYYFSIDNLCKDVFLRKHMDSQGFVFLSFIAGFKRIQALTQDFEMLRFACQESELLDLIRGEDGIDRLRRKEGGEKWVLSMEERDESVRNAGPAYHQRPQYARSLHMGPMGMSGNHSMSPPAFSPNGTESTFRSFGHTTSAPPVVNGNGTHYHPETPLSAAVPDFAPGMLAANGATDPLEAETTFSDEEVANLTLVFAAPKGADDSKPKAPYHNASSRTFSNGSIDTRSMAEEIHDDNRQGRTLTNGSHAPETSPDALRRSRSPFSPLSPTKPDSSNGPPVMWAKGKRQQAPVEEHNHEEPYTSFRARALKNREASTSGETHTEMKLLYEFWSHFLCRNFNLTMYSEFRKYAFEDAESKATSGMKNLISYYDEVLNSKKKVIPETLARHYVELVKGEDQNDRPAFERLRAAWRNGALDMKSRKKIDNFVDPKLREELELPPKPKTTEVVA